MQGRTGGQSRAKRSVKKLEVKAESKELWGHPMPSSIGTGQGPVQRWWFSLGIPLSVAGMQPVQCNTAGTGGDSHSGHSPKAFCTPWHPGTRCLGAWLTLASPRSCLL